VVAYSGREHRKGVRRRSRGVMRVVLDSNTICRDFRLVGSTFRVFFDGLARAGHSLHMSRVVIDEVLNKYAEELPKIKKSLDQARRVLGEIQSPFTNATIEELVEEYRDMLLSRFEEVGATTIDYPDVPHQMVVQRALNGRKPFAPSGRGYRDTLIWETVLDLAQRPSEPIAFISNDRDFLNDEGNLHPDLVADMEARGLQSGRIVPFSSLEEFVDEQIKPTMEALEDILQRLAEGRYPELDLAEEITVRLPYSDAGREWEPAELGFPQEFETPTISSVQDVQNIRVLDVRELYSGEFLIRAEADADCEFDVFVYKPDYYAMSEEEAPYIWDRGWNPYYFAASVSTWVHVEIEMTFDPDRAQVTSMQLLDMAGEPPHISEESGEQLSIF